MSSAQARVYNVLRQRLVSGHYSPGEALREEALSTDLGVSRTPVRAALKRLVDDGLVTTELGHGIHVHEWGERDLWEIYRIRLELEPLALELAMQNEPDKVCAELAQSNAEMERAFADGGADNLEQIQKANRDFHHVALKYSGAPRIRSILQNLTDMPIIFGSFFIYTDAEIAQSIAQHRDIVLAAGQKNPELTRNALEHHLRMSFAALILLRSSAKQLGSAPIAAHSENPENA
ncbi:MAG: GntR family transcriptional regulator [Pseudomonadota bacterium]|nr:GntR family transcriptional regulator [Pseudomonadota bacterium]